MVVKIMNMKSEILSDNLHNEKEFDNPNIYSDLGRNAHKFSINSCKKFAISYICMFLVAIICIVSTILALLFTNSFYVIKYIDSGHNTIYQVQFLSNLTILFGLYNLSYNFWNYSRIYKCSFVCVAK